jgi:hypothetical protein
MLKAFIHLKITKTLGISIVNVSAMANDVATGTELPTSSGKNVETVWTAQSRNSLEAGNVAVSHKLDVRLGWDFRHCLGVVRRHHSLAIDDVKIKQMIGANFFV